MRQQRVKRRPVSGVRSVRLHEGAWLSSPRQVHRERPGEIECGWADDRIAAGFAEHFLARRQLARLGLVPASSGAHALTAAGWDGPANYGDTAKFSAVIASWEQRFAARVVAAGAATLHLSVAAPPATLDEALAVAAEHFAFCPDNVWQGHHSTLADYAAALVHANNWDFWWD